MGDFLQPNAFARLHRMGEENYIQILASKKLGEYRDFSAEFDSLAEHSLHPRSPALA